MQSLISSVSKRPRRGCPIKPIDNMADLEAALEQYRINDEIVQGIVNDEALDSSLVLLDSLWESGDHAVAVTSTGKHC